jgi:hypothetical protein
MSFSPDRTMPIRRLLPAALVPVLALILLVAPLDNVQAQSRDVKLSGMGIRTCSEWQQWKVSGNAESRAMALEWAQGFIAGHNVYARTGTAATSPVVASVSVLIPLLDAYCQKNPNERLFAGMAEITRELGGAKVDMSPKSTPPRNPQPGKKGPQES